MSLARHSSDASSTPTASRIEIIHWVMAASDCLFSQKGMTKSHFPYVESLITLIL